MLLSHRNFILRVRTFSSHFGKEEHLRATDILGPEEDSLHHADLIDELQVVILATHGVIVALDRAHNCQEQVHQHNRVKHNTEHEEQHLGIAETLGIAEFKTIDGTNKNLPPNGHVLAKPLVLPVPERINLSILVVRRLNS